MKFHANPSSGGRVVPCGQTQGRTNSNDENNSRFLKVCKRLKQEKNINIEVYRKKCELLIRFNCSKEDAGEKFCEYQNGPTG